MTDTGLEEDKKQDKPARRGRKRRFLAVALVTLLLIPAILAALLWSGALTPVLKREAVAAIERMLPPSLDAEIGGTSVVLDGLEGVAVSVGDFSLRDTDTGKPVIEVDRTVVGVRTLSALSGKPELRRISLAGVSFAPPRERDAELPRLSAINEALPVLFSTIDRVISHTVMNGKVMAIDLADVTVEGTGLRIVEGHIQGTGRSRSLEAHAEYEGHEFPITGQIRRRSNGEAGFEFRATGAPLPIGRIRTMLSAVDADHLPETVRTPVAADVSFSAYERASGEPGSLFLTIKPNDLSLKLDEGDFIPVEAALLFEWDAPNEVLRLRERPLALGRSKMMLGGAIRDGEEDDTYQFELIANDGISDPADSPEEAVRFAMRAQGEWRQKEREARFDVINLASSAGDAEGAGKLDFGENIPSAVFALDVEDFALSGVKQFWPGSVARSARRWVLSNLAGGKVTKGKFVIAEPLKRRIPETGEKIRGDSEISLDVEGVRFDVTGNIPPVRDASGSVHFKDGEATVSLREGTTYLPSGRVAHASDGTLVIHQEDEEGLVMADLTLNVSGAADAVGELITYDPINAQSFRPYKPEDLSGEVDADVTLRFALNKPDKRPPPEWDVTLDLKDAAIATPFEGRQLSGLTGVVKVNPKRADIDVTGKIDGMPADITMIQPFGPTVAQPSRDIVLSLADEDRDRIAPGLDELIDGTTSVSVSGAGGAEPMAVKADLSSAELSLPWLGWSKGKGIGAKTAFDLLLGPSETTISNFRLDGQTFFADGHITVSPSGLQQARFGKVRLNQNDDISVSISRVGAGYHIDVEGSSFDARSLLRHVRSQLTASAVEGGGKSVPVEIEANVGKVTGFGGEVFSGLSVKMKHDGSDLQSLELSAMSTSGFPVAMSLKGAGTNRKIEIETLAAGETLRFIDLYGQVRGGVLSASLSGTGKSSLAGAVNLTDFRIFNEPRLASLVSSRPSGQSLNDAVRREIDTREVIFDKASVLVSSTPDGLSVSKGVVRGPSVGATFQGTVFDKNDRMRMTGTFMPAYEVNSLLAEIPVFGQILGNGRDKGLIGVTFKLEGPTKKPEVTVNPLSAIAPGVFRSIFEFR